MTELLSRDTIIKGGDCTALMERISSCVQGTHGTVHASTREWLTMKERGLSIGESGERVQRHVQADESLSDDICMFLGVVGCVCVQTFRSLRLTSL